MLLHFFFAVKVFIHSVVSQFGWIQYPSVFLSEHDPELAKGKCESKLSRLAGVCRGPRDARFSRTGVGIRRRNPERSRGSPSDPDTASFANAAPGSSTDTCWFVVDTDSPRQSYGENSL